MKTANYIALLLLSFLISLFSFQALAEKNNCKLTLGFDSWEPYQYMDIGNKVRGLDIDLLRMVAKRMSCNIEYSQGPWIKLLARLKAGEIDILLGASKTEKREKFAFFSDPYRSEQFTLYVRKGDTNALTLNSSP